MTIRGRLAYDDQGRLVEIDENASDPSNPSQSEIDPVHISELIADRIFSVSRGMSIVVWKDGSTFKADGKDGSIDSGNDAATVIQSAFNALDPNDSNGYTGTIQIMPSVYPISSTITIPRDTFNTIFRYAPVRSKGFAGTGGAVLQSDGLSSSDPLIETKETDGTGDLQVAGLTFQGIVFEGNNECSYLVDLPDIDTVSFSYCNFRDNAANEFVRAYATNGLDIASYGLPGKVEFHKCEFAESTTSYILFQDVTQCLVTDSLFNTVQDSHIIVKATDSLTASTDTNKTRITENEFNTPNQSGKAAGNNAVVKLVGDTANGHYVQDTIVGDNIMTGQSNADTVREDNANVRRTVFVSNDLIGSWNSTFVNQGPNAIRFNNEDNARLDMVDGSGQTFKMTKSDGAAAFLTTEESKPIIVSPNGTKRLEISQAGFVSVVDNELRAVGENVDSAGFNNSGGFDVLGITDTDPGTAADTNNEWVKIEDPDGNTGYLEVYR